MLPMPSQDILYSFHQYFLKYYELTFLQYTAQSFYSHRHHRTVLPVPCEVLLLRRSHYAFQHDAMHAVPPL